jgi:hypothetical protein
MPFWAHSQSFQFQKISLDQIDSIEKNQKAYLFKYDYPIGVSKDYFPGRENYILAQPIVYRKKVKGFKYETSYYYSLPDSTLRLIEYWWEGSTNSSTDFFELLVKNRKEIALHVNRKGRYQPATQNAGAKDISENDSVYVEQFYVEGLQRIRVIVSWK